MLSKISGELTIEELSKCGVDITEVGKCDKHDTIEHICIKGKDGKIYRIKGTCLSVSILSQEEI